MPVKPTKTHVRLFMTGMADLEQRYPISPNGSDIEIVIPTDHLDDLIATHRIDGAVQIVKPFSFTATNAVRPTMKIDPENAMESILLGMASSLVAMNHGGNLIECTILGLDTVNVITHGEIAPLRSVVVLSAKGIHKIPLDSLTGMTFMSEADKSVLQAAQDQLASHLHKDTSKTRVTLKSNLEKDEDATIKWTVPIAAPSFLYNLQTKMDGTSSLQIMVAVHNFTHQPWENATIELVNGRPHTYEGDSAEATVPHRTKVKVAKSEAVGGRVTPQAAPMMASARGAKGVSRAMAFSDADGMELEAACFSASAPPAAAEFAQADISEAAGLQRFVCDGEFDVAPQKSVVAPVTRIDVSPKTIYVYRHGRGDVHPDKVIEFKNTTGISLPAGHFAVDLQIEVGREVSNMGCGRAEFPGAKPDETVFIIHAVAEAIKVNCTQKPVASTVVGITFKDGVGHRLTQYEQTSKYTIVSRDEDTATVFIEHPMVYEGGKLRLYSEEGLNADKIEYIKVKNDRYARFSLPVKGGSTLKFHTVETAREQTNAVLLLSDDGSIKTVLGLIDVTGGAISENLQPLVDIAAKYTEAKNRKQKLNDENGKIARRYAEYEQFLKAVDDQGKKAKVQGDYADLIERSKGILDKDLPEAEAAIAAAAKEFREKVAEIAIDWSKNTESD